MLSFVLEDKAKQDANNNCYEEPSGIVLRVPHVRPMLFQETNLAQRKEWLRIFGKEVEILGAWSLEC